MSEEPKAEAEPTTMEALVYAILAQVEDVDPVDAVHALLDAIVILRTREPGGPK